MAKQQIGRIVSKESFLKNSSYNKEEYEGLIVGADLSNGLYQIGIELGGNQILIVDQVKDYMVEQRVQQWMPKIQEIQTMELNPEDEDQNDIDDDWLAMKNDENKIY